MQSMIKRKVDISMNSHIELIQQLVLDAHTINQERYIKTGRKDFVYNSSCALYYRMLRQTGHTAALKKLLSPEFMFNNSLSVFGIFHNSRERDAIFRSSRDIVTNQEYPPSSVDKREYTALINNCYGSPIEEANVIVFSDTLHDPKRIKAAQEMVQQNSNIFPNLTLVVYLG